MSDQSAACNESGGKKGLTQSFEDSGGLSPYHEIQICKQNFSFGLEIHHIALACSPFSDPDVMRVNRPILVRGDFDDEATTT